MRQSSVSAAPEYQRERARQSDTTLIELPLVNRDKRPVQKKKGRSMAPKGAVVDLFASLKPPSTLLHGDCLEQLATLRDNSVDLVLTDLPYGTTACAWDFVIPMQTLWHQLYRVAKTNAAFVFTAQQPFSWNLCRKTSTVASSRPGRAPCSVTAHGSRHDRSIRGARASASLKRVRRASYVQPTARFVLDVISGSI
jgi:hypothetical protein